MNNEFAPDLITLIDDEGNEHSFEILDTIEHEDSEYYGLSVAYQDSCDEQEEKD